MSNADAGAAILDRQRAQGKRLQIEFDRPFVSAHEGEMRAERMRRIIDEKRQQLRDGGAACAACPAAQLLHRVDGTVAVRCGVERSLVTERENPSSLTSFCLNDDPQNGYPACPSWRAEKERQWHGKRSPLVGAHEGV